MTPEQTATPILKQPWLKSVAGISAIILLVVAAITYKWLTTTVSIDLGVVSAPVIAIGPEQSGILDAVYVHAGDTVVAGKAVAQVGGQTLYAKIAGTVLAVQEVPGQVFSPTQPVVTMIDPQALRVVGTVDENKGFARIHTGDPATFTIDAFGGATFTGVVDEVSPTSNDSSVVFSISDHRPTKQFTVKIKFDTAAHPEFKNGMSAKITIFAK